MDAVVAYGTPLVEDPARIGPLTALGLDETLFARAGRWRIQHWCTSIVDVSSPSQLLDVIPGRTAAGPTAWINAQPHAWRAGIAWGVLDLSGPYRKTFTDALGHTTQVADPFHVITHANAKLDECRRRVQQETLGHRGRKTDPLYRSRRLLTRADERLGEVGRDKLVGLLEAGDPRGEVRLAWHAKETIRGIYAIEDPADADSFVTELADDMTDPGHPIEVRSLGRTLRRWHDQIVAWHRAHLSNGPTEAVNNLIKRVKRIGFGFRRFAHYRLRVLLYAGRPNWDLLATIDPAQIR
jgi:transposase